MQDKKFIGVLIVVLIAASLLPFYLLYTWIERAIKPRHSLRRFFAWLLLELLLVAAYTFGVVLLVRLIFPAA